MSIDKGEYFKYNGEVFEKLTAKNTPGKSRQVDTDEMVYVPLSFRVTKVEPPKKKRKKKRRDSVEIIDEVLEPQAEDSLADLPVDPFELDS